MRLGRMIRMDTERTISGSCGDALQKKWLGLAVCVSEAIADLFHCLNTCSEDSFRVDTTFKLLAPIGVG